MLVGFGNRTYLIGQIMCVTESGKCHMQSTSRPVCLLVVDDEVELLNALCNAFRGEGFEVTGCADPTVALSALRAGGFDLLLSDLTMPGMDGIQFFRQALQIDPTLVGVLMTGSGTIQEAVEAMKIGAFDFVLKPFRLREILPVLNRAIEARRQRVNNTSREHQAE